MAIGQNSNHPSTRFALAQQILAVARQMDANESVVTDDERVNYQQCAWF
ncbi:hypothetical protein [Microcoleus sp. herbarium2]